MFVNGFRAKIVDMCLVFTRAGIIVSVGRA